MTRDTIMNDAFWRSSMGIAFLKAQAWHEAGREYPAPAADWVEAQRRVFARAAGTTAGKSAGGVIAAGGAAAAASGDWSVALFVIGGALLVAAIAFIIIKNKRK
jgi:type IV secretory pathway VirB2 component (pilin)